MPIGSATVCQICIIILNLNARYIATRGVGPHYDVMVCRNRKSYRNCKASLAFHYFG